MYVQGLSNVRLQPSCRRTAENDALYKRGEAVQATAEVPRDGANECLCFPNFWTFQALVSPRYLTLESVAAKLLCIRDIRTVLNLSRPATCRKERSLNLRDLHARN